VLHNVLSYISTEVHPSISGTFFGPEEVRSFVREKAAQKLTYLEHHLIADKQFLVGDSFTIADAYLYIVLSWTSIVNIDLTPYPKVKGYFERVGAMENVKAAHARIATNPSTTI
jgi:glutathione S-transferase